MGAIYISPKSQAITTDVLEIFNKKGFSEPIKFIKNQTQVLLFKKQFFESINEIKQAESSLYLIGTCFYKEKNYEKGPEQILKDFISNKFNANQLTGSYFLLFHHNNELSFFSDQAATQNIFFHKPSGVISSSFLACLAGASSISGTLKLNKQSLSEILITGNLIGPDTLVENIERFEPVLHKNLPNINRVNFKPQKKLYAISVDDSFENELNNQLKYLSDYFFDIRPNIEKLGAITGVTGGFDSRLLYLNFKKGTTNYAVYSTSRSRPTKEFICASSLMQAAGENLLSPVHTAPEKMDTDDFTQLFNDNFYLNDGLIRRHQLWTEEIKGRNYLKNLYGDKKIGFSGVGGEQYRNSEYLIKKKYVFSQWIYFEMIYRYCKNPFFGDDEKHQFLSKIQNKISKLLEKESDEKYISRFAIKRYYNQVFNPANRTIRNNVENQMIFFLSPFTEQKIAEKAYHAFPFLGTNHEFEKEMINSLAPEFAHIELDYGYSPNNKVSLKYKIVPIIKAILGLNIYTKLSLLAGSKKQTTYNKLVQSHPSLENFVKIVEAADLPIKIDHVKKSNEFSPLLFEAGLFLKEMDKYLEYDKKNH